jgi:hypothetical protein
LSSGERSKNARVIGDALIGGAIVVGKYGRNETHMRYDMCLLHVCYWACGVAKDSGDMDVLIFVR